MTEPKSPPRLIRSSEQSFIPRFAYGDQAQAAVVSGPDDATELGSGFARMEKAKIPWTIKYDEVILVLEGRLTIRLASGDITAEAHEAVWLPAGTELVYETDKALVFYAIHPANWTERFPPDGAG